MPQTARKPKDLWTDEEFIETYGEDARKLGRPLYLGKLRRDGWTGRIRTYLVWCESCQRFSSDGGFTVAHEAGYEKRVECSMCRTRQDHLIPVRRIQELLLNPHRHPWLIAFLLLAALLTAVALR